LRSGSSSGFPSAISTSLSLDQLTALIVRISKILANANAAKANPTNIPNILLPK
jgi:hypothetical protein